MEPPEIYMEFPGDPRHARVARTAVAAAAVPLDFTVERLDDLRLVVDEAFNALTVAGGRRVTVALAMEPVGIGISMCGLGSSWTDEPFAVLGVLGDAIAPGWRLEPGDEGVRFVALIAAEPG